MTIVDANLLLYAVNPDAPLHRPARRWLESLLSGTETVGFAWNVLLAFLRLSTRVAAFPEPLTVDAALDLVDAWLSEPCAVSVHPGERHVTILRNQLAVTGAGGNLTSDAHLAALAIEHNAELCSCDGDFARFPALRWRNPLAKDA